MRKVIIADDEAKVCLLIEHLVDWEKMDMEMIGVVHDGKEAYEMICDRKPDIVITDIRMPTYDGIELIKRTKEILPNTYFVIVSGYNHFEYAQSAIKYGAEDYLLKPLKKKELENTLRKITEKDNEYVNSVNEKIQLKERLQYSEEKNKQNFLVDILTQKITNLENINHVNREYSCEFKEGFYFTIVVSPYLGCKHNNEEMYQLLLNKLLHMFDEIVREYSCERVSVIWKKSVILFVNAQENVEEALIKRINRAKLDIMKLNDIFDSVDVVVGISNVFKEWNRISDSLEEAQKAIKNRVMNPNSYIIMMKDCPEMSIKEEIIEKNFRTNFLGYLERMDVDRIHEEIIRVGNKLSKSKMDGQAIYECYIELVNTICFGAKNYMGNYKFPEAAYFEMVYDDMQSLKEIFSWLGDFVKSELTQYMNDKKEQNYKPIREAKQYINDYFNQSISLEYVSTMVGFNPAYFSTLFKRETGKNFTEYIVEVRMQNAKQLLTQTNMDIVSVANEVGYTDIKYFSKIFKKATGVNPSEYRRLYG
ncbi:MAG: response regulator [Lachnospiraceae bacterium]|nr:response regulator [Lachnospiraceae bacterium]